MSAFFSIFQIVCFSCIIISQNKEPHKVNYMAIGCNGNSLQCDALFSYDAMLGNSGGFSGRLPFFRLF